MRQPLALSLGLAAVLVVAGCSASPAQTAAGGEPRPGGELVWAHSSDPVCLDPNQTDLQSSRDIGRQFADSLLDAVPVSGELKPWLATEWAVNEDATRFTFTLRDDVTFSNGEKFDATAVKTAFDGIRDFGAKAIVGSHYLDGYTGTEVLAPNKVAVSFEKGNVSFLQAVSTVNLAILAPSTYTQSAEDRCRGGLAGTGPFVLDSYEANSQVVLSKRKGYQWAPETRAHQGEAYLDKVTYRIVPEAGVRVGSLQSGEIAGANSIPTQNEETLGASGFQLLKVINPGVVSVYLANNSSPVLRDESVRKAIYYGIDREEIRRTLYTADDKPATHVLKSGTPGYKDFGALIGTDQDESRRLLDGAGWLPGPDGIRAKDGLRATVTLVNGQSGSTAEHELIAQQLKRIGVELSIKNVSRGEMITALEDGSYDLVPYGLTRADADSLRHFFSVSRGNWSKLTEGPLEELLQKQASTPDPQRRQEYVDQATKYILEHAITIPKVEIHATQAAADTVGGLEHDAGAQLPLYDAWQVG